MKYGCCTTIDNYNILEDLGFDYIELAGNQIYNMSEDEFLKVKNTIEKGSVKCCGFNAALTPDITFVGEGFDIDKARDYAESLCQRGKELNIKAIGIGSPKSRKFKYGDDEAKAWEQAKQFLDIFSDVAKKYGITVMYESLNRTESEFGLKIREGAELVADMNKENLKIVFDIYHMNMENEGLDDLMYSIPYIYHIHIAERVGEERRYPSDKLYDYYKRVLTPVIKLGYDGAICTEAFDGDVREGAERSIKLLKKLVAEIEGEA